MIDAGPSLRAAEGISGLAFVAYLLGKGWSARPSRVDGISILSKSVRGSAEPAEFILPVVSGFSDQQRRVADGLRTVAGLEGRSVANIADEIRQSGGATEMGLAAMN